MPRVFLTGPRACGKTSLGKALAKRLGWTFTDTDEALVARQAAQISEIVRRDGWDGFRRHEHDTLSALIRETASGGHIIATGGGIVLLKENRTLLAESGTCIYLQVPAGELALRLQATPLASQRPSLTGKGLVEEVAQVVSEREPLYLECADIILDGTLSQTDLCSQACRMIMR